MGAAEDFDTDMQTIRDYVALVTEKQTRLVIAYTSALSSVETTLQTASPEDASPDYLKAVVKSGLKSLEKVALQAVKERTGADLAPVADVIHALADEAERAARAAAGLGAAQFIGGLRASITNAYTRGRTGDALREQIEAEYKQGDEGQRGGYIAGVQIEKDAVEQVEIPAVETLERALLEGWINEAFSGDVMEGPGIVVIQFDSDGALESATVEAPLGDRVAGSLNRIMPAAGTTRLMDLDVVKKVWFGDRCMCFDGNNAVRKSTNDSAAEQFLTSEATWALATRFKERSGWW